MGRILISNNRVPNNQLIPLHSTSIAKRENIHVNDIFIPMFTVALRTIVSILKTKTNCPTTKQWIMTVAVHEYNGNL